MSNMMSIRFASDMPVAAVEVLSPDLETVKRLALEPGAQEQVEVPSEGSFIRVLLPSGRNVTLRHGGDLDYVVSRSDLEVKLSDRSVSTTRRPPMSVQEVVSYHQFRSAARQTRPGEGRSALPTDLYAAEDATQSVGELPGGVRADWTPEMPGRLSLDGRELAFAPTVQVRPYTLRVTAGGIRLVVSLPGNIDAAYVRVDEVREDARVISVRASTTSDAADTVGAYLARGDYYAAETMAPWAGQSESMLNQKMRDPYAATVGAYLLLRLERFDLMRDWARNLANWFEFLPDGCVIWAWQNIVQRNDERESARYLLEAVKRGLPIHTEGLRLLSEGLRVIGSPGIELLAELTKMAGRVVWNSPFTSRLEGIPESHATPTTFDVGYMPVA